MGEWAPCAGKHRAPGFVRQKRKQGCLAPCTSHHKPNHCTFGTACHMLMESGCVETATTSKHCPCKPDNHRLATTSDRLFRGMPATHLACQERIGRGEQHTVRRETTVRRDVSVKCAPMAACQRQHAANSRLTTRPNACCWLPLSRERAPGCCLTRRACGNHAMSVSTSQELTQN